MKTTLGIIATAFALTCGAQPQATNASGRLPGHSHASPLLQHDALNYAAMGARAPKDCQIKVVNTAATDAGYDPHRPWTERWTVDACGKTSVVVMHFIPDATGTTITVSPGETTTR